MYCIGEETNVNCTRITKIALEVVTFLQLLKTKLVLYKVLQFVYHENAVRNMRGLRADDGKYLSSVHI
jgi:hypothetical protein